MCQLLTRNVNMSFQCMTHFKNTYNSLVLLYGIYYFFYTFPLLYMHLHYFQQVYFFLNILFFCPFKCQGEHQVSVKRTKEIAQTVFVVARLVTIKDTRDVHHVGIQKRKCALLEVLRREEEDSKEQVECSI